MLTWEAADSDEPGDQNADSELVDHGYWSLGPARDGWGVELIEQDEELEEIFGGAGIHLGYFTFEDEAKTAANEYEEEKR